MTSQVGDSFTQLVKEFSGQVRHVKALFAYTNPQNRQQWSKDLQRVNGTLTEVENKVRALREAIDGEKELLPKALEIISRQKRQNAWLEHMDRNRPSHLPGNEEVDAAHQQSVSKPSILKRPAAAAPLAETEAVRAPAQQAATAVPAKKQKKATAINVPRIDFLTSDEFAAVPSYAKGRVLLETVNNGVEELNEIVKSKYTLLSMNTVKMSDTQLKLYNQYIETDGPDTKGLCYIQERELKAAKVVQLAGPNKNILPILRCANRIKEFRTKNIRCYAINPAE